MADLTPTKGREWAIFAQEDGPGGTLTYLPVHDMDDFEQSLGDTESIFAIDPSTPSTLKIVGEIKGEPEDIEVSITPRIQPTPDLLQRLQNPNAALYLAKITCGRRDNFVNWTEQVIGLHPLTPTGRGWSGVGKLTDNDVSTIPLTFKARSAYHVYEPDAGRQSTSEALALNDIAIDPFQNCDSGVFESLGQRMIIACDAVGLGTANVQHTTTTGTTWTAAAADPGGADEHLMVAATIQIDKSTSRWIMARGVTDAAAPAELWYSDDTGATWTSQAVGSTNGEFFARPKTISVVNGENMWGATDGGYIFKGTANGTTWTAQESGVITAGAYGFVHALDEKNIIAGAAADVIVKSTDGGVSWTATTATGNGGDIDCGWMITKAIWFVGTDDGELFRTADAGVTWTEISFVGTGVGAVTGIAFHNELNGFMLSNNATPVGTILFTPDGGKNWRAITTPTNLGLNSLVTLGPDKCHVVGEIQNSTGVIISVSP